MSVGGLFCVLEMPWTYDNPPAVAQNWTDAQIRRCVDAANAVLDETGDDQQAIFACIHAAGKHLPEGRRMPETKTAPQFTKEIKDRAVTGIFAVHGNIDSSGDRSWPGSFADTKIAGRDRTVFLWQHDNMAPPVAVIKSVHELKQSQLPAAVFDYAPDATGGVEVTREYLDTPRGNEILTGIKAGAIDEMSYAYEVSKFDFEEIGDEPQKQMIRNLRGVRLFDISDVNWGMNPATIGSKSFLGAGRSFDQHSELVVSAIEEFIERTKARYQVRAKEGRMFSAANMTRMGTMIGRLREMADEMDAMMQAATPPKTVDPAVIDALWVEFQRSLAYANGVFRDG